MPIARFQMPDGRIARFEVPDGLSPEQAQAMIEGGMPKRATDALDNPNMATEGMGNAHAALIGAGRTFDKIGSGVKQWFNDSPELAAREKANDEGYAKVKAAHPLSAGVGEVLPAAAGGLFAGIPLAAGISGASGMLQYGTPEERLKRGLVDAATNVAGGVVAKGGGKALTSAPVSQGVKTALQTAKDIGFKPRLSEVNGSPFWRMMEDYAARTPGGAGVMREFTEANAKALNTRAAQGIGETADELTPKVFGDAAKRIGGAFEAVKALPGKPVAIGPNVGAAADDILRMQAKMLPAQQDAALVAIAKQAKALAANNGRIDGEAYQLTRSGLSDSAWDATGTNRVLYGKLLAALDDSAESSLRAAGHTDLVAALKAARPQYGNLKVLEKGAVAEGGNVSAARLASALRTSNPAAFREGRMAGNPLFDIAQIGEKLKPLQAGSPTYERTLASNPLATVLNAVPAYAAAKITTGAVPRWYASNVGGTAAAHGAEKVLAPTERALIAALLQRQLASTAPVMAEK